MAHTGKEAGMERGLLWLPLLGVFIGLAWAGWNEYQKVQAYEAWAKGFERSKYDLFSMLGQSGDTLTWGRPTRQGPVELKTLSLHNVVALHLSADETADGATKAQQRSEILLELQGGETCGIPFTDRELALRWEKALQQSLLELKSAST
jgi:hypothetical protein